MPTRKRSDDDDPTHVPGPSARTKATPTVRQIIVETLEAPRLEGFDLNDFTSLLTRPQHS